MGGIPTLIGETGIPFDMNGKKAYRTGDFSVQVEALDAVIAAQEQNFVSFTLWVYTADNSNARGDLWNDEDLSLFSRDQMTGSGSIHDGGRALQAAALGALVGDDLLVLQALEKLAHDRSGRIPLVYRYDRL